MANARLRWGPHRGAGTVAGQLHPSAIIISSFVKRKEPQRLHVAAPEIAPPGVEPGLS